MATPSIDKHALDSFHAHLSQSKRVLALLGAGLSASSGLPTFRGAGGLWRSHDSISLATPEAFAADPSLVWHFYNYRRHMALQAQPNPAHYALAELARKLPGFQCLSQNVDGLSQRAEHPPDQLQLLHGTLFELKCASRRCDYHETNFTDPVVPALAIPTGGVDPTSNEARREAAAAQDKGQDLDISDVKVPIPSISTKDLPQCPKCNAHLLRPGVVWFGESLPASVLKNVDDFIDADAGIDLIIVIGTSAKVYPAAGYIDEAREKGARVCVVNMDTNDAPASGWAEGDWLFQGDAATVVPELLKPVIGEIKAKV
ncbi:DHS-like NAD/FAD-binding domain-containing protein [Neohortaea acidophila]|uniref:DHS-like NAD/FAD-binding domain-containing protein n=1 Tax=Neohortaea acidophila TaxID=245834 RepID=A0A6A6Q0E0_9PEZI|nr:DHS-like NAD/FAD-binding domain-containing protein [Neohortaea acidophila]KAF2485456.1 DHS-like NAD/FAD-binding domain-containing protein [Neohortaea acidophila]